MQANFTTCLAFVRSSEGGWSNLPGDHPTQNGVTLTTFRQWRHDPKATVQQLRVITDVETSALYAALYFQACRCQDLPVGVDLMVFDMAVNAGVGQSACELQRVVGFTGDDVDGHIGDKTLARVWATNDLYGLLIKLSEVELTYYRSLGPKWDKWGHGWTARVQRRVTLAVAMNAKQAASPQLLRSNRTPTS